MTISAKETVSLILQGQLQLIDVRAPVEFSDGHIPHSHNIPILENEERAMIGTTYKQQGSAAAIELGYSIISGEIKAARIARWIEKINPSPIPTAVMCFRGGLRSKITQQWLHEAGYPLARVEGGYKELRRFLNATLTTELSSFTADSRQMLVLSGKTGSGKSLFLENHPEFNRIDLEKLANHRGSAFGAYSTAQPSQTSFENALIFALLQLQKRSFLVEDESRLIGHIAQPDLFFATLRESPILLLETPLETRVENTFKEYVLNQIHDADLFLKLKSSLDRIQRKLGGLRHQEISQDLALAHKAWMEHQDSNPSKVWIEKLLSWYYDPIYESSLARRNPRILLQAEAPKLQQFIRQELPQILSPSKAN